MSVTSDFKELHDHLLTVKPDGAEHDASACPWCTPDAEIDSAKSETKQTTNNTPEGGVMSEKNFTEEDIAAAVAKATAELASELNELKGSLASKDHEAEVAKAVEEVSTAKDAEIADLRKQLDTAVLEAEAAKTKLSELTSLIEEEKTRAEREAELAARRDERLAKVASVASFPEEYLTANADRWAAMSDEDFEAVCVDYAAASKKDTAAADLSRETAMQMERVTPSGSNDRLGATKSVLGLALTGVDFRSL